MRWTLALVLTGLIGCNSSSSGGGTRDGGSVNVDGGPEVTIPAGARLLLRADRGLVAEGGEARLEAWLSEGALGALEWGLPEGATLVEEGEGAATVRFDAAGLREIAASTEHEGRALTARVLINVAPAQTPAVGSLSQSETITAGDVEALTVALAAEAREGAEIQRGDVDLDGALTEADLTLVEAAVGQRAPTWVSGDVLRAGVQLLLVHPALMDPAVEASLRFEAEAGAFEAGCAWEGEGAPKLLRAQPGYAWIGVDARAACLTAARAGQLTLVAGGDHPLGALTVEPLPLADPEIAEKRARLMNAARAAMRAQEAHARGLAPELGDLFGALADAYVEQTELAEAYAAHLSPATQTLRDRMLSGDELDALLAELEALVGPREKRSAGETEGFIVQVCSLRKLNDLIRRLHILVFGIDLFLRSELAKVSDSMAFDYVADRVFRPAFYAKVIAQFTRIFASYIPFFKDVEIKADEVMLEEGDKATLRADLFVTNTALCADFATHEFVERFKVALIVLILKQLPLGISAEDDAQVLDLNSIQEWAFHKVRKAVNEGLEEVDIEGHLRLLFDLVCNFLNEGTLLPMKVDFLSASCGGLSEPAADGSVTWTCEEACGDSPRPEEIRLIAQPDLCGPITPTISGVQTLYCEVEDKVNWDAELTLEVTDVIDVMGMYTTTDEYKVYLHYEDFEVRPPLDEMPRGGAAGVFDGLTEAQGASLPVISAAPGGGDYIQMSWFLPKSAGALAIEDLGSTYECGMTAVCGGVSGYEVHKFAQATAGFEIFQTFPDRGVTWINGEQAPAGQTFIRWHVQQPVEACWVDEGEAECVVNSTTIQQAPSAQPGRTWEAVGMNYFNAMLTVDQAQKLDNGEPFIMRGEYTNVMDDVGQQWTTVKMTLEMTPVPSGPI